MHCATVMVDPRVPGAQQIKLIDFGLWFSEDPSNLLITGAKFNVMLQNLSNSRRPMKELLLMMGFESEVVFDSVM